MCNEMNNDEGEINMATLISQYKMPFIIKDDKYEQFKEKCKKYGITEDRRKKLMDYSKRIRSDSNDENKEKL
jgi:hypothetical protein